jgi:hypothetical protein
MKKNKNFFFSASSKIFVKIFKIIQLRFKPIYKFVFMNFENLKILNYLNLILNKFKKLLFLKNSLIFSK